MGIKPSIKDIILPYDIKYEKKTYNNTYGKFYIYPFGKGVGVTVANSLRRVLMSSIPGYAITSIKIDGVNHEFESIKGVREDLTDIILEIKKISIKLLDNSESRTIRIVKKGPGVLTAGDFEIDSGIQISNKDLVIANLNEDAELVIEAKIEYGRGYRSAENILNKSSIIGEIPIDAIFSPIKKVNFFLDDYRVGDKTDCEKITLEVWTNGLLNPIDAVATAASIIRKYFSVFSNFEGEDDREEEVVEQKEEKSNDILSKKIEELELTVRSYNCLRNANIKTIGELIEYDEASLLKIKSFGKKSLSEINAKLAQYNLSLKKDEKSSKQKMKLIDIDETVEDEDIDEGE